MSAMEFREPNEVLWRGVRPAHKGIQIAKWGSVNNGTLELYQVSTGKVFYLTSWSLTSDIAAAGDRAELTVYDIIPSEWFQIAHLFSKLISHVGQTGNFWPPLEIPASYTIDVVSHDAGNTAVAYIHGWEE